MVYDILIQADPIQRLGMEIDVAMQPVTYDWFDHRVKIDKNMCYIIKANGAKFYPKTYLDCDSLIF
jgi:hypothetical protein